MINVHIYPSPLTHESRILKEASSLRRRLGFEKISLVGVPGQGLPPEQVVDENTTIYRLRPQKGHGPAKIVRHLAWCLHVLWFCLKQKPGCVNCHSLPVLPIGVVVKLFTGAKLVYDAHELETETSGTTGVRQAISRVLERVCLPAVDLLVVVSPGIEAWYRRRYDFDRIATVLNSPVYRAPAGRSRVLRDSLGISSETKIVLYQGVLAPHRGVEELIAAAPLLREAGYVVVLMGYGSLAPLLEAEARSGGAFLFHPAVSPDILLSYTASADVGVCLIQANCLSYRLCLPNKMFEYIMAGVPVLASDLPDMRRVIDEGGVGVCIDIWDPQSIRDAVVRADAMRGADLLTRLDDVARSYSWEAQEERLVAAYRKFVLPPAAAR